MIGRILNHYHITAKLGREVALKVLPAEMASDPNRISTPFLSDLPIDDGAWMRKPKWTLYDGRPLEK